MEIRILSGKEQLDAAILIKECIEDSGYSKDVSQSCMDFFLDHAPDLSCFGAYQDKELIGLLAFEAESFHIMYYFVEKREQGKGIGRLLLDTFLGTAAGAGIARVTVHAVEETLPVYEALGFTKDGEKMVVREVSFQPMEYLLGTEYLGKEVTVTVDQPYGSLHPHIADLELPCNIGYVEDLLVKQGIFQNAYIYGLEEPTETFKGFLIGIIYHHGESESRWIVAKDRNFREEDVIDTIGAMEANYESHIRWLHDFS